MKFDHYFKNWRTTLGGVGAICTALGDIIAQFVNKDWDANRLGADFIGLFSGYSLICARDAAVSEQEHHEERREIAKVAEEVK